MDVAPVPAISYVKDVKQAILEQPELFLDGTNKLLCRNLMSTCCSPAGWLSACIQDHSAVSHATCQFTWFWTTPGLNCLLSEIPKGGAGGEVQLL